MEERMKRLENSVEELSAEIRKLMLQLLETPQVDLSAPEFGWKGLDLEATEVLADSEEKISSREISQKVNQRREEHGFLEKTSPASVARALSALISKGIVMRTKAGREVSYFLNPSRVMAITGRGDDPKRVIDDVFNRIERLPDEEKERTDAVWYSLSGPEEAPTIFRKKTELPDTKALCKLFGMPRPPQGRISIGGIQGISLKAIETRLYVFLLR